MKPLPTTVVDDRDRELAARANAAGAHYSLRIILEARHRHAGVLPVSLALALIEQESDFQNVFGHDPTIFAGAGKVNRAKYLLYKARRLASGNRKMQGVGPGQLTYWTIQDAADKDGGAWRPSVNIATALSILAGYVKQFGVEKGLAVYNAGEANWRAGLPYSKMVQRRAKRWHDILT
jgi:hypothetical protein